MTVTTGSPDPKLIGVYLNDHLAGATGGVDLARRLARAHGDTEGDQALHRMATEIAEDRESLLQIMAALAVPVRRYKVVGGWLAEKVGRLKLNGRLFRRSPLSSVLELETMMLGVQGKEAGWRTMRAVAEHDDRLDVARLDELLARAQSQAAMLEELRMRAVEEVFSARASAVHER
jgi:hypothetical protein